MQFEPADVLKLLLKQGAMLKAHPNTLIESEKSHCVILVNAMPLSDENLVFVNTTTQYEQRIEIAVKRNLPVSTIVMVRPNIYHHIPKYSAVDCNRYVATSFQELTNLYEEDRLTFYNKSPILDDEHLQLVLQGIKDSPMVENAIKKLI